MTRPTAFLAALFLVLAKADVVCSEIVCHAGAIDLVFVMDESGSVGTSNYKLGLQAAQKLTQSLDIGTRIDQSHVGFVVFNKEAFVAFNLNAYLTNAAVFDAIGKVGYSGGDNDIAKGMDVAIKQVFRPYGRTGVPRIMIIITDGQDSSDVGAERSQAVESRIRTYALGVGPAVDMRQLTRATGDVNRVYSVSDYASLQKIMDQICEEIAVSVAPPVPTTPPPPAHKPRSCGCDSEEDYANIWLDIAFVVDSSDTVAQDDFDNIITMLDQIGMFYTIGAGNPSTPNKYTRVAIINAAEEAYRFADFSKYKTGDELSKDVRANLKKLKGRFDVEKGIKAAQDMFDEETEARNRLNVRRVVVLFSTEAVDCRTETVADKSRSKFQLKAENKELCRLVSQMQGDNVAIITAAMKLPEEKNYPFMDITEPCDRLVNNEEMIEKLIKRLCLANCYCLDPYTQFEVVDTCEKFRECIFVHDMALSYSGAQKTCARENEKLTDVFSEDKNNFLKSLHLSAGFFPYWIGGKASGKTINWDCGIQGAPSDFYNWGDAQPDSKNECVYMKQYQGFKTAWYSDKCGMMTPTHFFSCQKDACSANNYCDFEVKKNAH